MCKNLTQTFCLTTKGRKSNIDGVKGERKRRNPLPERKVIMATNKNIFTNATAMNAVSAIVDSMTDEQLSEFIPADMEVINAFRAKVARITETMQPKARANKTSATARANMAMAETAAAIIAKANKPVTWAYIAERMNGITTSQKATAVLAYAIESGSVERETIKGKVYYQPAGYTAETVAA